MKTGNSGWDNTIVALATPPGVGALGIIRLSGMQAIAVVNALFPSKDLSVQASHTLHVGLLKQGNQVLDEVVVSLYKAPRSYTGEDVVEISCHGSPFIQQQIIEACLAEGARLAKPGEFTQRAFLAGKLDLTQAEAVADLIASNTAASQRTALRNMRGGFSTVLSALREQLIRFSALIELELDFSQEDVEFADRSMLTNLLLQIDGEVQKLIHSFRLGNVIKNGVSVAIVGKPNAGKSTLLNTLLNEERAIVSEIPGTTRDTVEEVLNIDGLLFRLIDTAGIRSHTTDVIESAGIERSRQKMNEADLLLYLFDAHETDVTGLQLQQQELEQKSKLFLLVGNKIDAASDAEIKNRFASLPDIVFVAARENRHIEDLKKKMVDAVLHETATENIVVTNARHYTALLQVSEALADVLNGIETKNLPGDLLALDIRRCLHYLGEITGSITNEDQLDFIFSKFCIGK